MIVRDNRMQYSTREQLINSVMDSLKIDKNPFNNSVIEEYIAHIPDSRLREFYSKLFGTKHSFLNGMDRVSKVAELIRHLPDDYLIKNYNNLNDEVRAWTNVLRRRKVADTQIISELIEANLI